MNNELPQAQMNMKRPTTQQKVRQEVCMLVSQQNKTTANRFLPNGSKGETQMKGEGEGDWQGVGHSVTSKSRKPAPSLGQKAEGERTVTGAHSRSREQGRTGCPEGVILTEGRSRMKSGPGARQRGEGNSPVSLFSHLPIDCLPARAPRSCPQFLPSTSGH